MNVGQSRGAPAPAVTPALLLLLAAGGRAQPAPAQTAPALGFADLEPMALEHNPTLGQAEAAVRAAEGRRLQAGLYPNPIVGYQGEELSTRAFSQKSEHFVFFEQSIVTGGKLGKSRRIFAQEKARAEQDAAAQRQRILNAVRVLYYEALGAQPGGAGPVGVVTPDVKRLPWTMGGGVKVFHLTAEVVKQELMPATHMGPAKVLTVWGYNGSAPGPMIEANEGDRVRVVLHNQLPEPTTIHWHGLKVPVEMDGTPFISQPPIEPGGSFAYEFTLHQNGTFFYHSHGAMQEMLGMIGLFVIHPRRPHAPSVDKDFGFIMQGWAVLPNNPVPNTFGMEFNWLTLNGKAAPATTPLIIRQGERVRIRLVNLGMDHHPIHLHGHRFYVTGTEGGRIPEAGWYPGNTVLVGVAQARDIEFEAKYAGDWMLHCHLPHHMMNQMVSMVGPMAHAGHGLQTGKGMEEGMGVVRRGGALSEEMGPGLGRGLGLAADADRQVSNLVGPQLSAEQKKRVPGYPQDDLMMMDLDAAVAKPETHGLAKGWTASMMGMMSLVRVLPPEKHEEVMARVKAGRTDKPPAHHHHE